MAEPVGEIQSLQRTEVQSVQYIYFNGFDVSGSLSDMGLTLMVDGQPQVRVSMSFTTAKTLAQQLVSAIEAFESATGNKLLTMEDVRLSYEKAQQS